MSRAKALRNRMLRRVFHAGQRLKVDVLPRHFYSSIPDIRDLRARRDWQCARSMIGVAGYDDLDGQLKFLSALPFADVPVDVHDSANLDNGAEGYGPIEAAVLHAFIAGRRPGRVVQVGAGVATAVMLRAAQAAEHDVDITCVDPYPTGYLIRTAAEGRVRLLAEPAQTVSMSEFDSLDAGDLLFIDSTHTVKPGSEVNRLVLEVLPRLNPGVIVHVHDVTWPYDYYPDILDDSLFFWEESTLLHAFLIGNKQFMVRACLSALHHERPQELQALVSWYLPQSHSNGLKRSRTKRHFPSSVYLESLQSA